MARHLGAVTFLVAEYDAAIGWFTNALGFTLVADVALGDGKRWVLVAPSSAAKTPLLLAEASDAAQAARVGDQTGGRVGFFLHTDDFSGDHARMLAAGVVFREAPRHEPYGTVAVFEDLYGNLWDLIEPRR
ncbi:MAG: VOC family protein [Mesorhizobium sp.]|nr:VOC family protein [Mesorhizobium sp.]